jgi:hypothetical protein
MLLSSLLSFLACVTVVYASWAKNLNYGSLSEYGTVYCNLDDMANQCKEPTSLTALRPEVSIGQLSCCSGNSFLSRSIPKLSYPMGPRNSKF